SPTTPPSAASTSCLSSAPPSSSGSRSMPELVEVRRHDHATVVTLNREQKLNAISNAMERALCDVLERSEVRRAPCVVFTGGPRVFSAGADVNEMPGMDPAAVVEHYHATGDFAER